MKRVLADVRAFGLQYLRSREGAFFAFAFPVILMLLFGAIFSGGGSSKVPLSIQDLDDTPTSRAFVGSLNNTSALIYSGIPKDVEVESYIHEKSINTALLIPRGFQENVTRARAGDAGARVNITLYGDPTQSSYGIALGAVNGAATQFNFGIAGARPVVFTDTRSISVRLVKYADLFLPGVIGFSILTTPMFGMATICGVYRDRRYFKLLATTSLSKGEWLASKVIFHAVIILVSAGLMVGVKIVVFGGATVITPLAILIILAGTLEFTSLGMILGLFVRDSSTANAIANAVGFPMMFLAGTFFPIDTMPSFLQGIARILPLTFVNEGLRATMVFDNNALALNYLAITLVLSVVFFLIPARGLSWKSK